MDILARIQKATTTRSAKDAKTIESEGSPGRSFPIINTDKHRDDKERRFL